MNVLKIVDGVVFVSMFILFWSLAKYYALLLIPFAFWYHFLGFLSQLDLPE